MAGLKLGLLAIAIMACNVRLEQIGAYAIFVVGFPIVTIVWVDSYWGSHFAGHVQISKWVEDKKCFAIKS